jgi:cysteine desulfurase
MGEHASVNMPLEKLKAEGYRIAKIPTRGGVFDLSAFDRELTSDTVLVSVMLVNNETGAVYNIPEISAIIKRRCPNAYLHVDATQGYMKIPFSPAVLGADMVTISAHKIKGPKGIGALYISDRVKTEKGISPIVLGGGQENGLRSGTENVPAIVAFGAAVEVGLSSIKESTEKLGRLYSHLAKRLRESAALKELSLVVPPLHVSHIANITLPGIKSETMLHYLSSLGIFVSSGSACSSNSSHRSEALIAFGKSEAEADTSIRVSFSDKNEISDVDALIEALESGITRLARIKR